MLFSKLLGQRTSSVSLETVPTDEIVPVHFFDDTQIFRNSNGCWFMRFDDVLDPDKIHGSLARLLEKPGWRKLGGRFRLNANGKLEIHVPQKFTKERPAVTYTHVDHSQMSLAEHPLASRLPTATLYPSLQAAPEEFNSLGMGPKCRTCMDDFLAADVPQLDLVVTSFRDATLVSVNLPHVMGDGQALADLAAAWSLVMAGRDAEIAANLSYRDDPMDAAGRDPEFKAARHVLEGRQLRGLRFVVWIVRFMLDMLLWWPHMEYHTIYLPPKSVAGLKARTAAGLRTPEGSPSLPACATPFVSTADVVYAWMICLVTSVLSRTSKRSVLVGFPCNIRDRAPSIFKQPDQQQGQRPGVWLQNASPPLQAIIPARDVRGAGSVARVAQYVRHAINTQATEEQIHAAARMARDAQLRYGLPPIFGDMSQFPITATNWTQLGWYDKLNFEAALVAKGRGGGGAADGGDDGGKDNDSGPEKTRAGRPVYFQVTEILPKNTKNPLSRNLMYMYACPDGGYWVVGKFPPVVWDRIARALYDL